MEQVIKSEGSQLVLHEDIIAKVVQYETAIKTLEGLYKELKEQIKDAMVNNPEGMVKKVENEQMSICYVPSSFSENFDTKRFKADYPELYLEYCKEVEKKSSLRITIKKTKE